MGGIFSSTARQDRKIHNKIIKFSRYDIIHTDFDRKKFVHEMVFTDFFADYCQKYYESNIHSQMIQRDQLHIEYECMLPPCGTTRDATTGKNLTSRFHVGDSINCAYIRNPTNRNEYLPLRPIFEIIRNILENKNLTYIVMFERLTYNTMHWEEGNAALIIYMVQ